MSNTTDHRRRRNLPTRLAVGLGAATLTAGFAATPAVAQDLPTGSETGIETANGWTPEVVGRPRWPAISPSRHRSCPTALFPRDAPCTFCGHSDLRRSPSSLPLRIIQHRTRLRRKHGTDRVTRTTAPRTTAQCPRHPGTKKCFRSSAARLFVSWVLLYLGWGMRRHIR